MDDSPRSSKRRKLDAPSRKASTPIAKSTLRRVSTRAASQNAPHDTGRTHDTENEASTPTRRDQASRAGARILNGGAEGNERTRTIRNDTDIYDDIEGALPSQSESREMSPAPKPQKKAQTRSTRSTPAQSTVNGSKKKLVNDYKHGADLEAAIQGEIAEDVQTPSKRPKKTAAPRSDAKNKTTTIRSSGRTVRRKAISVDETAESEQFASNSPEPTTPSKSQVRSARQRNGSVRTRKRIGLDKGGAHISDAEGDLAHKVSPSASRPVKDRRRANRADHSNNQVDKSPSHDVDDEEEIVILNTPSPAEDELEEERGSVIGSVLDITEPSPFNRPSPAPTSASRTKEVPALLHGELKPGRELDLLKSIVVDRIMGNRPVPLVEVDQEYKTVYQLVEHTITAGEGNSMLLIGARGSGKTALVNHVLSEVSKDNAQDYHVVRLNGFIHTDDKIALREIWRQLGKEMDIEEDGGLSKNYADTLTTLLALLSHPSEQTGEMTEHVAKAVIIIMDEFDLFALHPRQTLLYNLFDIAQSRKAPIAVLGLTTRIDVANSLEKRVKSRFSHRYVHLSLAKTFTAFQEICKATLVVHPQHLSIEERAILSPAAKTTPSKKAKKESKPSPIADWNANISSIFASKHYLETHLAPHFYRTKSASDVLTSFLLPIASLSPTSPSLYPTTSLSPPDSKLALLPQLSTLSLALLISAARLDIIHDTDTCNFNMAYNEYVTLASKARIQSAAGGASASGVVSKVWGKEIAKREWEGLIDMGLVMPVVGGITGGFGMVKVDVALEEIGGVIQGDKGIERALERWCRQL